jgi:nitrogen fixation/metabolism regulation signal transduction histidine kinase
LIVEKAVAAVKFHPDWRNVFITVGRFLPAEADFDARNLESTIYKLLLYASQAATCSSHVPEVKVHLTEVDKQICVTISDNGPGILDPVRRTLFNAFVAAGRPNGTGLGLTLTRRIAEEHGGSVRLMESNVERTVFTLSLTKNRSLPLEDLKSVEPDRDLRQWICELLVNVERQKYPAFRRFYALVYRNDEVQQGHIGL